MQTIDLIGEVSMLYPKELPEINHCKLFAFKSNGIQHTIKASGEFKNIVDTLSLGQRLSITCNVSYQRMSHEKITVIEIKKLTLL